MAFSGNPYYSSHLVPGSALAAAQAHQAQLQAQAQQQAAAARARQRQAAFSYTPGAALYQARVAQQQAARAAQQQLAYRTAALAAARGVPYPFGTVPVAPALARHAVPVRAVPPRINATYIPAQPLRRVSPLGPITLPGFGPPAVRHVPATPQYYTRAATAVPTVLPTPAYPLKRPNPSAAGAPPAKVARVSRAQTSPQVAYGSKPGPPGVARPPAVPVAPVPATAYKETTENGHLTLDLTDDDPPAAPPALERPPSKAAAGPQPGAKEAAKPAQEDPAAQVANNLWLETAAYEKVMQGLAAVANASGAQCQLFKEANSGYHQLYVAGTQAQVTTARKMLSDLAGMELIADEDDEEETPGATAAYDAGTPGEPPAGGVQAAREPSPEPAPVSDTVVMDSGLPAWLDALRKQQGLRAMQKAKAEAEQKKKAVAEKRREKKEEKKRKKVEKKRRKEEERAKRPKVVKRKYPAPYRPKYCVPADEFVPRTIEDEELYRKNRREALRNLRRPKKAAPPGAKKEDPKEGGKRDGNSLALAVDLTEDSPPTPAPEAGTPTPRPTWIKWKRPATFVSANVFKDFLPTCFDVEPQERMPKIVAYPDDRSEAEPMFKPEQRILILGEADFSFSMALCRAFEQCGHDSTGIVATSYMRRKGDCDKQNTRLECFWLNELSGGLQRNLDELAKHGAVFRHGVDCRDLQKTLFDTGIRSGFDVICFPFPRGTLKTGKHSENDDVMSGFFRVAAKHLNDDDGVVRTIMHINRGQIVQFDYWRVRDLAEAAGLEWTGAQPFAWQKLKGYQPRDMALKPWRPWDPYCYDFKRRKDWGKIQKCYDRFGRSISPERGSSHSSPSDRSR